MHLIFVQRVMVHSSGFDVLLIQTLTMAYAIDRVFPSSCGEVGLTAGLDGSIRAPVNTEARKCSVETSDK